MVGSNTSRRQILCFLWSDKNYSGIFTSLQTPLTAADHFKYRRYPDELMKEQFDKRSQGRTQADKHYNQTRATLTRITLGVIDNY